MTLKTIYLIVIALLLCSFSYAEEQKTGIRVVGECEKEVQPDMVSLRLGIEVLKSSVKSSTSEANERYNSVLKKLKSLNLKNAVFSTYEYTTREHKEWENKKQVSKGYKTNIGLEVESSDLSRLGEAIKLAGESGIKNISGPTPFVSNELRDRTYNDCLAVASKNARAKAALLAKSMSVKLGKAFDIVETKSMMPEPRPIPYMAMAKSSARDAAPQIEYGNQKISLKLQVAFNID